MADSDSKITQLFVDVLISSNIEAYSEPFGVSDERMFSTEFSANGVHPIDSLKLSTLNGHGRVCSFGFVVKGSVSDTNMTLTATTRKQTVRQLSRKRKIRSGFDWKSMTLTCNLKTGTQTVMFRAGRGEKASMTFSQPIFLESPAPPNTHDTMNQVLGPFGSDIKANSQQRLKNDVRGVAETARDMLEYCDLFRELAWRGKMNDADDLLALKDMWSGITRRHGIGVQFCSFGVQNFSLHDESGDIVRSVRSAELPSMSRVSRHYVDMEGLDMFIEGLPQPPSLEQRCPLLFNELMKHHDALFGDPPYSLAPSYPYDKKEAHVACLVQSVTGLERLFRGVENEESAGKRHLEVLDIIRRTAEENVSPFDRREYVLDARLSEYTAYHGYKDGAFRGTKTAELIGLRQCVPLGYRSISCLDLTTSQRDVVHSVDNLLHGFLDEQGISEMTPRDLMNAFCNLMYSCIDGRKKENPSSNADRMSLKNSKRHQSIDWKVYNRLKSLFATPGYSSTEIIKDINDFKNFPGCDRNGKESRWMKYIETKCRYLGDGIPVTWVKDMLAKEFGLADPDRPGIF